MRNAESVLREMDSLEARMREARDSGASYAEQDALWGQYVKVIQANRDILREVYCR